MKNLVSSALFIALCTSPALSKETLTSVETVSIEVVGPNGSSSYVGLLWTTDSTVLSAMKSAKDLKFTAEWFRSFNDWLILSLGETANEGFGDGKKNWSYCVNGVAASVGVSAFRLPPDAAVKWIYTSDYPIDCSE